MAIKTIGVIDAGQMGSGIAYVAALNNFQVILNDIQLAETIESIFSTSLKNKGSSCNSRVFYPSI